MIEAERYEEREATILAAATLSRIRGSNSSLVVGIESKQDVLLVCIGSLIFTQTFYDMPPRAIENY